MTKTLTEQWRDNDLADDKLYYWRISDCQELVQNKLGMCAYRLCNDSDKIECLAPVPSYDEYQKLQKRLEIATKVLKEYANEENWRTATTIINTDYFEYECSMYGLKDSGFEEAQRALKEMEGVK